VVSGLLWSLDLLHICRVCVGRISRCTAVIFDVKTEPNSANSFSGSEEIHVLLKCFANDWDKRISCNELNIMTKFQGGTPEVNGRLHMESMRYLLRGLLNWTKM